MKYKNGWLARKMGTGFGILAHSPTRIIALKLKLEYCASKMYVRLGILESIKTRKVKATELM